MRKERMVSPAFPGKYHAKRLMFSGKTIKMALIATYPHLSKIVKNLAAAQGVDLLDIYASFEDAVQKAREARNKVDIIISKGGTAEYIRRAIDLPVVSIPSTPYDVVSTIFQSGLSNQEIALVVFHKNIHDTANIARMFNLTIHEYTFKDQWDIMEAVRDAKSKGIKTILGGILTASYAQSLGLRYLPVLPVIFPAFHIAYSLGSLRGFFALRRFAGGKRGKA